MLRGTPVSITAAAGNNNKTADSNENTDQTLNLKRYFTTTDNKAPNSSNPNAKK